MSDQELIDEIRKEESELNFLESLKEFMDQEEIKDLNINDPESFQIQSKEQANYFVKKILEIRSQQNEINKLADNEIKKTTTRVNQWRESEIEKTQQDEEYIMGLLRTFAEKEIVNVKKGKTIKLPFGSLSFKKQQPKYEYDDKKLLEVLESADDLKKQFVEYKSSAKKQELKKAGVVIENKLYINNKVIDGVTITPQDEKFEIK